jgi:hypothetical protein
MANMRLWKRLRQWSHLWFDEYRQRLEEMVDEWRVLQILSNILFVSWIPDFLFQIGCCANPARSV